MNNAFILALQQAQYLENTLNGSKKYWGFIEEPEGAGAVVFWGRIGSKPQSQRTTVWDAKKRMGIKCDDGYQKKSFLGTSPDQWIEKSPNFVSALALSPATKALWDSYQIEQAILKNPASRKTQKIVTKRL